MKQLPLAMRPRTGAVFDSFAPGVNAEVVAALRGAGSAPLWIWGGRGVGKTHLLQAVCAAADAGAPATGGAAAYFPLARTAGLPVEALRGFEQTPTLCVDDLDAVAGDLDWERALFSLFNASTEARTRVIFAANAAPRSLPWAMEDWRSRAAACVVYQLRELDDGGRIEALRLRAAQRGLQLPAETADYLLKRMPRDLPTLFALLDELDEASLAAQRRLTVPFIREALERRADTPPSRKTTQTPAAG
jgi:DnaA family protein